MIEFALIAASCLLAIEAAKRLRLARPATELLSQLGNAGTIIRSRDRSDREKEKAARAASLSVFRAIGDLLARLALVTAIVAAFMVFASFAFGADMADVFRAAMTPQGILVAVVSTGAWFAAHRMLRNP